MRLEEKINNIIVNNVNVEKNLAKIADEFAIGFAEWMAKEYWLNSNTKYLKSTRTSELLEIYKKEK